MKPERPVTGKHLLTGHILRFNLSDSHQHDPDPPKCKTGDDWIKEIRKMLYNSEK